MKKAIFFILFVIISVYASASIVELPKERAASEDFVIAACDHGHAGFTIVNYEEYFRDLYDCGFNTTGMVPASTIEYAKKYNLKIRLDELGRADSTITDLNAQAKDWAEKIKAILKPEDYKYIYQVYVRDEPKASDLPKMKAYAEACRNVLGLTPYINLLPDNAGEDYIGMPYDAYVDTYLKECKLNYVCYDCYAFFIDRGFDQQRFYQNIEAVRKGALRNNAVFHNIILCAAHFNYSEPDDYSIAVQGWSTLAYGGKGLIYFSVIQPPIGNYRKAPYTGYGDKTDVWYSMKDMNYAIHNIMPYYKDLKNINVYHTAFVPKGSNGPETAKNIASLKVSSYDNNNDLLVGEFVDKKGKEFAIIVNKNPKYGVHIDELKFKKGKTVKHVSEYSNPFKWSLENHQYAELNGEDLWIKSGHGILVFAE